MLSQNATKSGMKAWMFLKGKDVQLHAFSSLNKHPVNAITVVLFIQSSPSIFSNVFNLISASGREGKCGKWTFTFNDK